MLKMDLPLIYNVMMPVFEQALKTLSAEPSQRPTHPTHPNEVAELIVDEILQIRLLQL